MIDPAEIFRSTAEAVEPIVDTEPDPTAETPCPEWTYAELLGHLVGGDQLFLGILSGASTPPDRPRLAPDPDRPPPSPRDYRRWSGRLANLFVRPETMSGVYDLPAGRLPGPQVAILRSVEHLLHGWDLARSAGASPAGLTAAAITLRQPAEALLAAVGEQTLAGRRPFAPSVEVGPDADPLASFVALFGRDPGWQPDPVAGYAKLKERFAAHEDVELPDGTRRGYGADGMRVANQVFACTYRDRLMIKLPEADVNALIAAGLGDPLSKPGQRPMREWVLVPFDGAAGPRADRAYAFVSGRHDDPVTAAARTGPGR